MTDMLAATRHRGTGSGAQPDIAPAPLDRNIDSTSPLVINWAKSRLIVARTQIPNATALREQDDVIYDPTMPADKRYAHYVTVEFAAPRWEVWVCYSPDGITWYAPVQCTMNTGGPLLGQDPSIVQTLHPSDPEVHRDGDGRLWMYLENHPDPGNHDVHAYSSADGLVWTLEQLNVIPRGAAGQWDASLVGSPNARYIDGQYVVGYEGTTTTTESWGVAYGTDPTVLTKLAANPLIEGAESAPWGESCFMDAWWPSRDGSRIMLVGHSGVTDGNTMPRFYTENTDPLTWTAADFVYINDADPAIRNDLTVAVHLGRLVTAPNDDQTIVTVPLA